MNASRILAALFVLILVIGLLVAMTPRELICAYAEKLPFCHEETTITETVTSTTTETRTYCVFVKTTTVWNTTTTWTTTTIPVRGDGD